MRPSDLNDRIAAVRRLMERCALCAWRCGVNRLQGERGRCGLDDQGHVARECISVGEEGDLSPSHLVYLSGCALRCEACISAAMVAAPLDHDVTQPRACAAVVEQRRRQGARNLNLLGGDPSVNALFALELVAALDVDVPLVWNSNGFHTAELVTQLRGVVDVWLLDLKFGNDACALALAGVGRYFDVVTANLRALHDRGERLLVRHLARPGHAQCCTRPVVKWIERELPRARLSLVDGFVPGPGVKTTCVAPSPIPRGYAGQLIFTPNGEALALDPGAAVMGVCEVLTAPHRG